MAAERGAKVVLAARNENALRELTKRAYLRMEHERGTNKGWMRETSYYVKASKHPLVTSANVAGVSVAILAACRSK